MKLYIEFLLIVFSWWWGISSRRWSHCSNEMGCHPWVFSLPQCALLSEKGAPLTSSAPFADVSLLFTGHLCQPQISCWRKTFRPINGRKSLWKSVCGSLRGCDCCNNISISEARCRQKVSRCDCLIRRLAKEAENLSCREKTKHKAAAQVPPSLGGFTA